MSNEVVGPILGTVVLAGVTAGSQPKIIDGTNLIAGVGSDGKPRWILVDSTGAIISSGGGAPSGAAGGDLAGTYPNPIVKTMTPTTPQTYTITNVITDRSLDANATSIDELADAYGTLISDLRALGLVL